MTSTNTLIDRIVLLGLVALLIGWAWTDKATSAPSRIEVVSGAARAELQVPFSDTMGVYLTRVRINRQVREAIVDTGATVTVIPVKVAAGLLIDRGKVATIHTASGKARAYTATLKALEIGNRRFTDLPVMIMPMETSHILLGNDVTQHFDVSIKDKVMTLYSST